MTWKTLSIPFSPKNSQIICITPIPGIIIPLLSKKKFITFWEKSFIFVPFLLFFFVWFPHPLNVLKWTYIRMNEMLKNKRFFNDFINQYKLILEYQLFFNEGVKVYIKFPYTTLRGVYRTLSRGGGSIFLTCQGGAHHLLGPP